MTENEQYIYEHLVGEIRMGFLSLEDIIFSIKEMADEEGFTEEFSKNWVEDTIRAEWKKHVADSKTWIYPTDPQKLLQAFENLRLKKIVALHNAGYTSADGTYDAVEVHAELLEKGVESIGYCFYHGQDLERAVTPEEPCLMIAYQKVNNTDERETLKIGRLVAAELREAGFDVEWEEDVSQKIEIKDIKWQKVYDENARWEHHYMLDLF